MAVERHIPQPAPPVARRAVQAPIDDAVRTTRQILEFLFGPPAGRAFAVRLWTGDTEGPVTDAPAFTLVLQHPGALRRMFVPATELNLAESYLRDDFDLEGDVERATMLADDIADRLRSKAALARLMRALLSLPRGTGRRLDVDGRSRDRDAQGPLPAWRRLPQYIFRHSKDRDAETISFAYDTSNAFYELWLDERMVYTCAYYRTGREDVTEAQVNKLELVCRKLRLQPGDRLLDVGCGWGALLHHAVEHFGVTGFGVTLSREQAAWANARFARSGIADRCRVEVCDSTAGWTSATSSSATSPAPTSGPPSLASSPCAFRV
jgi:cyclopropane-fatty-acyl-phospholipid synthase